MSSSEVQSNQFDIANFELTGSPLIEASAGTGKTHNICGLYLRLLLELDLEPRQILVVTYTRAATEELRGRVRSNLAKAVKAINSGEYGIMGYLESSLSVLEARGKNKEWAVRKLEKSLLCFDEAAISTIHGFAKNVLDQFAFESGVVIGTELAEDDGGFLATAVQDCWRQMVATEPPSPLLDEILQSKNWPSPEKLARWVGGNLRHVMQISADAAGATLENCQQIRLDSGDAMPKFQLEILEYCAARVRELKDKSRQMTFDDLLTKLLDGLNNSPELAALIRSRLPVAMIDEFQDTDPVQYQIFQTIYGGGEGLLVKIGDPKQSIYQFRGADIFSYMAAAAASGDKSSLGANYRSSAGMIEAVNSFFESFDNPFAFEGIEFNPVEVGSQKQGLLVDGAAPTALQVAYAVNMEPKGGPKKDELSERCLSRLVADVFDLLTRGMSGKATVDGAPLAAKDIAILVKSHLQAKEIRAVLARAGIGCAYVGRASVFDTPDALLMELLLRSVNEIENSSKLKPVLLSPLFPYSASELDALFADEGEWEELVARFRGYRETWRQRGFMPMFRQLLHGEGIAKTLLASPLGDRSLTNLLQVSELAQDAEMAAGGQEGLLRWFASQRSQAGGEAGEKQLRLESDESLVRITTIHASKGLEFPVVLIPNLDSLGTGGKNSKVSPLAYHDENKRLILDFDSEAAADAANLEDMAEKLRLLYVAMTRSKYLCKLYFQATPHHAHSVHCSVVKYMIENTPGLVAPAAAPVESGKKKTKPKTVSESKTLNVAIIEPWLRILQSQCPEHIGVERLDSADWPEGKLELGDSALAVSPMVFKGRVDNSFRVASYSWLASGEEYRDDRAGTDEAASAKPPILATAETAPMAEFPAPAEFAELPAGAAFGNAIHEILQKLEFGDGAAPGTPDAPPPLVAEELSANGIDAIHAPAVWAMVLSTISTPIPVEPPFRLLDIPRGEQLRELEFHFPLGRFNPAALAALLENDGRYGGKKRHFKTETITGFMKGFIDLVVRHQDKWFVIDYKSNKLADYGRRPLADAILEHDYDLQYLIYSLALRRHLESRLPDYRHERDFGGVIYLFTRGLDTATPGAGAWLDLPDPDLLAKLDKIFNPAPRK